MKMSWKDWFSIFGSSRPGRVNVTCISVEKNSLARVLRAKNVERHFALNVIRRRVVKVAFDVVG